MKQLLSLFLTLLLIGIASDLRARAIQQPTGTLSGTVRGSDGQPLPGATATISGVGPSRTATTNPDGSFSFSGLPVGTYTIKVELEGFATIDQPNVVVGRDKETKLDLSLSVAIEDAITVTSESPLITGVGEVQKLPNGTGIVGAMFKSKVPVDRVEMKVPARLGFGIKASYLPKDWKAETREDVVPQDVMPQDVIKMSGPPRLEIPARFTIEGWNRQLEEFFKKLVEFNFGLGKLNFRTVKLDFKPTEPVKPVTPAQAAELPEVIRPGSSFSISPKVGYENGTWKLSIGNDVFNSYLARNPAVISSNDVRKALDLALRKEFDPAMFGFGSGTEQSPPRLGFHIPAGITLPPDGKISLTYQNEYGDTTALGEASTRLLGRLPHSVLDPPRLFRCTPKIFQNRSLCVCGFFPNSFSRSQLLLDGKRLDLPRSGSTDMVVFLAENLSPGKHVISWDMTGFASFFDPEPFRTKPSSSEQVEFVVLVVQGSIDQNKLLSGQRTDMRLRIIGTDEKLPIELENTTTEVIELEGGARQVIKTSGGNNNTLQRWVKAQHTGMREAKFNINYRLTLPPCPCNPDETEKAQTVGGNVSKPPDDPQGSQVTQPRKDCELILSQYNALSVEYGKLQSDIKRVLESCDRLDDGTTVGKGNRDNCRITVGVGNVRALDRAAQLREQMLDLLAEYRDCVSQGGN